MRNPGSPNVVAARNNGGDSTGSAPPGGAHALTPVPVGRIKEAEQEIASTGAASLSVPLTVALPGLRHADLQAVRLYSTIAHIRIRSFRHKGLKQLDESANSNGVETTMADRLRKQLFAMETAAGLEDLELFPGWRLLALKTNLVGFWSAHQLPRTTGP